MTTHETGVRLPSPPAFARRTPELRLARQPKASKVENRLSVFCRAKAVRHSSAPAERRRTHALRLRHWFARQTPELRLARQPKASKVETAFQSFAGRRLSAIVRPQPNVGGPMPSRCSGSISFHEVFAPGPLRIFQF
jgi:hypothetical protein